MYFLKYLFLTLKNTQKAINSREFPKGNKY